MSFSTYDVILVCIPFSDLTSNKVRPAIVIGFPPNHSDLLVVPLTSNLLHGDMVLRDWDKAGLNVPSAIKAQIATIESALIKRTVGRLTTHDSESLKEAIRSWLPLLTESGSS